MLLGGLKFQEKLVIIVGLALTFSLIIFFLSGCLQIKHESQNAKELWSLRISDEKDSNFPGSITAYLTEKGLLTLSGEGLFLIDHKEGEKLWETGNFTPLVVDRYFEVPILKLNDKTVVLPLREVKYQEDKLKGNNIPSLVKINLQKGEPIWKHPLARNTPPLNVTDLFKENGNILTKGNFASGEKHDSKEPVYGAHATGLAVHNLETGELVDAFSVHFGSILVRNGAAYFSSSEKDYYVLGVKDIFTDEVLKELEVVKNNKKTIDKVVAINKAGEKEWEEKGELLFGPNTLYPNFILLEGREDRLFIQESKNRTHQRKVVSLLNSTDGEIVSEYELSSPDVIKEDNKAFLVGNKRLKAINTWDGSKIWEKELESREGVTNLGMKSAGDIVRKLECFPILKDGNLKFLSLETGEKVDTFSNVNDVQVSKEKKDIFLVLENNKLENNKLKKITKEDGYEDGGGEEIVSNTWNIELEKEAGLELENEDFLVFNSREAVTLIDRDKGEKLFKYYYDTDTFPVFLYEDKILLDKGAKLILIGADSLIDQLMWW